MNDHHYVTISTAKEAADYQKHLAREDLTNNLFALFFGVVALIGLWYLMGGFVWVN